MHFLSAGRYVKLFFCCTCNTLNCLQLAASWIMSVIHNKSNSNLLAQLLQLIQKYIYLGYFFLLFGAR